MSQENVEIMREFYDRWSRGETGGRWWEIFDPAVEWHTAREDPDAEVYRGIAGLRQMMGRWSAAIENMRGIPEEFIDAGDRVFVWQRTIGRGAGSGVEVVWEGAYVWTLRDRKVIRVQIYFDRDEALEAAGLRE
jgi:ketosteroid isomerase-like protein